MRNKIFSIQLLPQYNLVCLEFQRIQEEIYRAGGETERRSSDGQDQRHGELPVRGGAHSEDFQPGIQGENLVSLRQECTQLSPTIDQMHLSLIRD